jgi:hypothetical protein
MMPCPVAYNVIGITHVGHAIIGLTKVGHAVADNIVDHVH